MDAYIQRVEELITELEEERPGRRTLKFPREAREKGLVVSVAVEDLLEFQIMVLRQLEVQPRFSNFDIDAARQLRHIDFLFEGDATPRRKAGKVGMNNTLSKKILSGTRRTSPKPLRLRHRSSGQPGSESSDLGYDRGEPLPEGVYAELMAETMSAVRKELLENRAWRQWSSFPAAPYV